MALITEVMSDGPVAVVAGGAWSLNLVREGIRSVL